MRLEGVSCVCGRTSSLPTGERNQRLPGADEVSMRHAGPRTPLRQISCVGGASQGRPGRYPFGSALTAPLKTFRFQRGPVLGGGKVRRGWDVLRTRTSFGGAHAKKPPLKGEVPAKRAERFVPHVAQVAAALSAAVTTTKLIGDTPTLRRNQARRSDQPKRQPLFGRRGLGRRGFSQRSRLLPRKTVTLFS